MSRYAGASGQLKPVAVLVAFIPFRAMGITANIMSLGGIAMAIDELVDAAIVGVEQTHKKLEQAQRDGSTRDARDVVEAVKEVAPASFFAASRFDTYPHTTV